MFYRSVLTARMLSAVETHTTYRYAGCRLPCLEACLVQHGDVYLWALLAIHCPHDAHTSLLRLLLRLLQLLPACCCWWCWHRCWLIA